jgi:Bacterial PH domain
MTLHRRYRRYLYPGEHPVIEVRRHWAGLAVDSLRILAVLLVALFVMRAVRWPEWLHTLTLCFALAVGLRWVLIVPEWWLERVILTTRRVLVVSGIAYRQAATIPLVKVTDITYTRSSGGMMFGYGKFVVAAGENQELVLSYITRPERFYIVMSKLLFGGE